MSAEINFIQDYPNVDMSRIEMEWNGRMGVGFEDQNQYFRERIIKIIENEKDQNLIPLKRKLFLEEAKWASKALSYRYYLTDLAQWLMDMDLFGSLDDLVIGFTHNMTAMKSVLDLKTPDEQINIMLTALEGRMMADESYKELYLQFEALVAHKKDIRAQEEAFEAYVTYREKPVEAANNNIKRFFRDSTMEMIALLIIIPMALLLGYYWFRTSIFVGLIPIGLAVLSLYIIYKIALFIIR